MEKQGSYAVVEKAGKIIDYTLYIIIVSSIVLIIIIVLIVISITKRKKKKLIKAKESTPNIISTELVDEIDNWVE